MKSIKENTINWLLEGENWIRYNTLIHLFEIEKTNPIVSSAYSAMMADHKVITLLGDIQNWDATVLKRHNDAKHPIHKLSFLAEIGISGKEPPIQSCAKMIFKHISEEGPFQTLSNYPKVFGGSGVDDWLWVLCDAPLLVYSLAKFGFDKNPEVRAAYKHLISLVRINGWPCAATETLGNFKGPGKASAPCPYANLLMLKAELAMKSSPGNDYLHTGTNTLLGLWEKSADEHPFLFKMGTDFRKLKVPFVWYDILHVVEVLSQFPFIHENKQFQQMWNIILSKKDENFRFKSESVWTKWKGWEFCQKREPSRWITLQVLRILKRIGVLEVNFSQKEILLHSEL